MESKSRGSAASAVPALMRNTGRKLQSPRYLSLVFALLGACSAPAFATDPYCLIWDPTANNGAGGYVPNPAVNTNQGNEHGDSNTTCSDSNSAYGEFNNASGSASAAFGRNNSASGSSSYAFGYANTASGPNSSAFGLANNASNNSSNAFGYGNIADGSGSSAFGVANRTSGNRSNAFGAYNLALGDNSNAFGIQSRAAGHYSTVIGYQSVANDDNVVSFGHSVGDVAVDGGSHADERNSRLIHVDDGIDDTDAVNLRQLNGAIAVAGGFADLSGLVDAFGGGAAWDGSVFTAPTYVIQGTDYFNVGGAFAAVDTRLTELAASVGTPGPQGPAGQGADMAEVTQMVAEGDAATLTASKSYTDTKSTSTLASANAYTDSKFAAWNDGFTQFQQQVDMRFVQVDARIDRIGAMSGAMSAAAMNTAGLPGQNRVGMGVGSQNGRAAVAIGFQRLVRPNASVSLTGAFSSGERAVSAGAGFSW